MTLPIPGKLQERTMSILLKFIKAVTYAFVYSLFINPVLFASYSHSYDHDGDRQHSVSLPHITNTLSVGYFPKSVSVFEKYNKIYTVIQATGDITVVDGKTSQVIYTIPTDPDPNYLAINENTGKIYVVKQDEIMVVTLDAKQPHHWDGKRDRHD